MSEWKEYRLGDICSKIGSGATPKGGKEAYCGGDTSLIRSQNVLDFSFSWDGLAYINDEQAAKLNGVEIEKGDVLLNITGDSVARACIVPQSALPARVNQHVAIIRGDATLVLNEYILYFLQYKKPYLLSLSKAGATRNALTKGMIEDFPIPLPPLVKQAQIVDVLSSLDDKIAVNKKICENLEAQAQALFKHWFVDFAPFKDGKFVESELGLIPEGLVYKKIEDMPHILETGKRPAGGVKGIDSGIPSIGAENIKGLGCYDFSKTKYVTEEYASTMKKGIINGYELLIYKDGGKPGYFIPNFAIFGEGYPYDKMCLNEHVFKLDFSNKGYSLFAYFFFKTKQIMSYLNAQGAKAAIPGINSKDIDAIMMPSLENEYVKNYCNEVEDIITQILVLSKESRRLAELRDTLLPKLMSGEIKVNEIEKSL